MPALLFPNPDTLRLVLASRIISPAVTDRPTRAGVDTHGLLWLEPAELPSRDELAAMTRLGVQAHGVSGVQTGAVDCWAALLNLQPAAGADSPGFVLFDVPDAELVRFVARVRRVARRTDRIGVTPSEAGGRAWVTVDGPPRHFLQELDESESPVEAFAEQVPGVWVRLGWEHPLPDRLPLTPGQLRFLRPPASSVVVSGSIAPHTPADYPFTHVPGRKTTAGTVPRIPVRFTLARCSDTRGETLWVMPDEAEARFWEFCRTADERVIRRVEVARVGHAGETRLVVRGVGGRSLSLPLDAVGHVPDPRVPGLFLPVGMALRPAVRVNQLARVLGLVPGHVTWVEPATGGVTAHHVPEAEFRPLGEFVTHHVPHRIPLNTPAGRDEPFAFDRFAVTDDRPVAEVEPLTEFDPDAAAPAEPTPDSGWLSRSLERLADRVRRSIGGPAEAGERSPPAKRRTKSADRTGDDKLSSADALVHGHHRAARRRELEARLLTVFPRLGPNDRAVRWAELATVYGATGNPNDAAVCWINAVWEADRPPAEWLEQWFVCECRTAKLLGPRIDLDRLLGERGRFGAGRAVAAFVTWAAHQPSPPSDLPASLHRVLAFLDHCFDDLPARAAWLAGHAVTRLCSGDALGLARWQDRILSRLRDKGPSLDLDEPSFLRFHGTAAPDRFRTAREWLTRTREPILNWVARLGKGGRLQWAGIDPEVDSTAAYALQMLAWGLGCLGERTRSRDWAARARKTLTRPAGPGVDPAVHAVLVDLFHARIRDAQDGRASKPGLPLDLQPRHEALAEFSRYAADRLRDHCRILEPAGRSAAYRGRDLKEFRGHDRLGERLQVLVERSDPTDLGDEARHLLAQCAADPSPATVPRVVLTLLELAPRLDRSVVSPLLGQLIPALDWTEAWVAAGRWTEAERTDRLPHYQALLLSAGFAAAAWTNDLPAVRSVADHLTRRVGGDPALREAVGRVSGRLFRALRKLGYHAECGRLLEALEPDHGAWPAEALFPPGRLGLAVGWFAAGDEDAGNRIMNEARDYLFLTGAADDRDRTELAVAYADALGFAPPPIALGRLEEIFQRLERVNVKGSTNRYYTLKPLQLIDTVVRSVVTEDFALGPAVRGWLDDDEFLIRRRIHRDMAAVLQDGAVG